jgi:hypothetical protein
MALSITYCENFLNAPNLNLRLKTAAYLLEFKNNCYVDLVHGINSYQNIILNLNSYAGKPWQKYEIQRGSHIPYTYFILDLQGQFQIKG